MATHAFHRDRCKHCYCERSTLSRAGTEVVGSVFTRVERVEAIYRRSDSNAYTTEVPECTAAREELAHE